MAGNQGKKRFYEPATSHLAEGRIRHHISALGLDSPTAYRAWCREQGFGASLRKSKRQLQREAHHACVLTAQSVAERERERHLKALRCRDDQYVEWCERHHCSVDDNKTNHQYAREMQIRVLERAEAALRAVTARDLGPDALVEAIYEGRKSPEVPDTEICRRIRQTFGLARTMSVTRPPLLRLVKRVYAKSRLYAKPLHIGERVFWQGMALEQALFQLALRHRQWVRQPETWKPDGRSPRRQFGSLVRHLLARYTVPAFLDAAWFEGDGHLADLHRDWFLHIGAGDSISEVQLPLSLTKRATHFFLHAPADVGITAALRWGQVLGDGGSAGLARAVIGSRLRDMMADEPFWATVIRFFINQPQLETHQVAPIVDYLYERKYVDIYTIEPDGAETHGGPPEPELEMKGRTLPALWRRVEEWHEEIARAASVRECEWARSGIEPVQVCWRQFGRDGVALHWTLEELRHSRELQVEGEAMHNCVATYVEECAAGTSSIWSLRARPDNETTARRVMTVEIDLPRRAIVQARGRFNRLPGMGKADALLKAAPEILRLWARQQNLTVSASAW
jgi:hypothetical protein